MKQKILLHSSVPYNKGVIDFNKGKVSSSTNNWEYEEWLKGYKEQQFLSRVKNGYCKQQ